jgi:beta-xylosidase
MIEAVKIWNEPNNLSHWDFHMDPEWREFHALTRLGAEAIRRTRPGLPIVLGGISPIDPAFISRLASLGTLDCVDAVAVHGFPLDWNHWQIDDWPAKIAEIEAVTRLPVWVTEAGASSFGAEEVQAFALRRTAALLRDRVARVFWYSLLDLPKTWPATTRHKESEGSSYYRHFYMGLIREDGTTKEAIDEFPSDLPGWGICQWFHLDDPRLEFAIGWLKRLGVKRLRTGISWADWHRPGSLAWFDRQMSLLKDFDVTLTLCFTPPSRGKRPCCTSPPVDPSEFADFAAQVVTRYTPPELPCPSYTSSDTPPASL